MRELVVFIHNLQLLSLIFEEGKHQESLSDDL